MLIGHNPYFNRWFSAIGSNRSQHRPMDEVTILILIDGFLQWRIAGVALSTEYRHNPYFNRWFSAIPNATYFNMYVGVVTILILIDGFLQ